MPLAFYFNPDDILSDIEKNKYKYFKVKITGAYFKNNEQLPFYLFDNNYSSLVVPVLTCNQDTGLFENKYNYDNILEIWDKSTLASAYISDYKNINKITISYNRWKLKYSDDKNPYITNTNYAFSKNQKSENMYYQYPQHYLSSLLCDINKNKINLLLPIGKNIEKYYSDFEFMVKNYYLSMDNYISNWFDMTEKTDIDYILSNTDWQDVHSDNKIFYKGILYNFNRIPEFENKKQFDKFAILCYVDDSDLIETKDIEKYVLSEQSMTYTYNSNNLVDEESVSINSTLLVDLEKNNYQTYTYSLYNISDKNYNYKFETNQLFTYNTYGTGKYVNIDNLCNRTFIDSNLYFDANEYYPISDEFYERCFSYFNEINNLDVLSEIITGYALIETPFGENLINKLADYKNENIYFSTGLNTNKLPLSEIYFYDFDKSEKYNYILYYKCHFISKKIVSEIKSAFGETFYLKIENKIVKYLYYPMYQLGKITLNDIFVPFNILNTGNTLTLSNRAFQDDLIMVDSLNISDDLQTLYTLSGQMYIENISNNIITLGEMNSDNLFCLVVDDKKDEILDILQITYTYAYNFGGNKYNVEKVINKINSVRIIETKRNTDNKDKIGNICLTSYYLEFMKNGNYDVKSYIAKGAKKAVVRQNSNILLFDEASLGKNNPILIIEENDVKASHGSSVGKIDDDTMFYLCSRGLTRNEATNLICLGKMEYLIKKIEDNDIKESLIRDFKERMI
jgi:hypothetical protein